MNSIFIHAAIQPFIAVVLKNGIITGFNNPSLISRRRELFIMSFHFFTQF